MLDHSFFMHLALDEAWKYQGLTYPNPAVGCCVVGKHSQILAIEAHKKAGLPHAEVNALYSAYNSINKTPTTLTSSQDIHNFLILNHNNIFKDVTLYVTLEPCSHIGKTPSCATLIKELGIKKIFVSLQDLNEVAKDGAEVLNSQNIEVEFNLLAGKGADLLFPFKKWSENNFVTFKIAHRLNGTIDGTVSSTESREDVHKMRDVCDLLVIGGNTVREDRPTLDARLCEGRAPDILIYSKTKEFDKTIPLFNVKDREVLIESSLKKIANYKNIIIEGGEGMFEATKEIVDYYLSFVAPTTSNSSTFTKSENSFEYKHISKNKKDLIIWMKRA
ncbi:MAG: bifunctional diaminohydroxyphosphoribosylaminopyrimidine deaminase/5-amino-6-(5-phosphoribosylamino)uracil reductase RibD [Helicobacteraceae bacterium]|nr:bifunctional diaminohydroxyphosphoribosylaminopyrimidine deaminase/5-amino-6-(5-phosphoribosylamino)uracil reductase RibD [Helicobacteraceae bacterium]